ncbi:hypothetical protein BKA81DRAFT_169101 [Phyllosticta paracitricarpa]
MLDAWSCCGNTVIRQVHPTRLRRHGGEMLDPHTKGPFMVIKGRLMALYIWRAGSRSMAELVRKPAPDRAGHVILPCYGERRRSRHGCALALLRAAFCPRQPSPPPPILSLRYVRAGDFCPWMLYNLTTVDDNLGLASSSPRLPRSTRPTGTTFSPP